ncbi:MAG: DUF3422 domain-containing protein [Pseudomonadota bacterium]
MAAQLPPQHPQRLALALELHARPFPELSAPCRAVHVAFKVPRNAAERDAEADRDHLRLLLDRFGAPHPAPGADHYVGSLGRVMLKWERHTEFVSYTLFGEGAAETPFDGTTFALFPQDWLLDAPGEVIAAALVRVEAVPDAAAAEARLANGLGRWFVRESLAASHVSDGQATAASDFRIHEDGMARFVILAQPSLGPRRLGRLVQRVLEIETYRAMSMLALPLARHAIRRLTEVDRDLAGLVRGIAEDNETARATLDRLTVKSAEIEKMATDTAFRFGAAEAYETILHERIDALREARLGGRQTIREFMARRYDPAMRTCRAAQARIAELSTRAARIADLLRTRVDVAISVQNQKVLESMDRRADLQLRLQKTVEGLSVVAISYYAVSLAGYVLAPVAAETGLSKSLLTAAIVPVVVLTVWAMVRRLRRRIER